MTKEEALEAWSAGMGTAAQFYYNYRYNAAPNDFEEWWSLRSSQSQQDTQTTTTGDGIPYEYKLNWSGYLNDGTSQPVQYSGSAEQRPCVTKYPKK